MDSAVGDPHLSTELRRLGRERGYWGVVLHNSSSGKVVAACVVFEGRRRVKNLRVFQVMAMAVRQEYRGKGLARQTMQRVQARIGEEVVRMGGGKMRTRRGCGESADGGYSLVTGLKSCMQSEGVGLYRALGWRGTGESWEWSSDEHAGWCSTRAFFGSDRRVNERKRREVSERKRRKATLQRRHANKGDRR